MKHLPCSNFLDLIFEDEDLITWTLRILTFGQLRWFRTNVSFTCLLLKISTKNPILSLNSDQTCSSFTQNICSLQMKTGSSMKRYQLLTFSSDFYNSTLFLISTLINITTSDFPWSPGLLLNFSCFDQIMLMMFMILYCVYYVRLILTLSTGYLVDEEEQLNCFVAVASDDWNCFSCWSSDCSDCSDCLSSPAAPLSLLIHSASGPPAPACSSCRPCQQPPPPLE